MMSGMLQMSSRSVDGETVVFFGLHADVLADRERHYSGACELPEPLAISPSAAGYSCYSVEALG